MDTFFTKDAELDHISAQGFFKTPSNKVIGRKFPIFRGKLICSSLSEQINRVVTCRSGRPLTLFSEATDRVILITEKEC